MPLITKQYKFCAAHKYFNPKWDDSRNYSVFGEDVRLHGHNYELDVTIGGPINEDSGFIIDIMKLNNLMDEFVIKKLDHSQVEKDIDWFRGKQPSTENLVIYIWNQIVDEIKSPGRLHCIKLRETGTIFTEYYGDED